MPSVAVTPASYAITWGSVETSPVRQTPGALALRLTMGGVTAGPGTGSSQSVTTPKLDRLVRFDKLAKSDGTVDQRFQLIWQQTMEAIEAAFAAISGRDDNQDSILARLDAAYNLATAANDNATSALSTINIADSFINPVGVLTASSDGTITIAAHTRVYGDGVQVSVSGGSLSGFASGALVTVYYDDAGRAGGAVSYQGTTDAVAQAGARHIVGQVTIPAAGEVDTAGAGPTAPGYVANPDYDPRLLNYVPAGT